MSQARQRLVPAARQRLTARILSRDAGPRGRIGLDDGSFGSGRPPPSGSQIENRSAIKEVEEFRRRRVKQSSIRIDEGRPFFSRLKGAVLRDGGAPDSSYTEHSSVIMHKHLLII